jgi:hypothetical protein
MTCVTATHLGPPGGLLADSHRKCVYLPLNRLQPPTWKDNSPVLDNSPLTRLLVDDIGGHARAMELIADTLAEYQNGLEPNVAELANDLYAKLMDRYEEAVSVLQGYTFLIVQCILSRQRDRLQEAIPGTNLRWEQVTASGFIWFEGTGAYYNTPGYLVAPYIWLWMLARLPTSHNTKRLCQFLRKWQFNDYTELLPLATGEGLSGNTTWQNFEAFCCSFRTLRSLGFGDREEVPLKSSHAGCKLRDDRNTMVVNRLPDNADAQLSYVILNGTSAPAGDFFFSIEIPTPNGRGDLGETVREVGQCKLVQRELTQATYNAERKKSAGPDDVHASANPDFGYQCLARPIRAR